MGKAREDRRSNNIQVKILQFPKKKKNQRAGYLAVHTEEGSSKAGVK